MATQDLSKLKRSLSDDLSEVELHNSNYEVELHDSDDDFRDSRLRPRKKQVKEEFIHYSNSVYRFSRPRSCGSGKLSKKGSSEDRSITLRLSNPDVLDCPICFDSFTFPIYQCGNGHVACSNCCNKLHRKCAVCKWSIGSKRCKVLEEVLESVKISCPYAKYGCKEESLSYSEKNKHKLDCTYVPCSCPYSGCDGLFSSKDLFQHFKNEHHAGLSFSYHSPFFVTLDSDCKQAPIKILQEIIDRDLFILHNDAVWGEGNAVSISCIGSKSNHGYQYEICAESEGCSLRFMSFTKNIEKLNAPRSSRFLLVPSKYFGASKSVKLKITIQSNIGKKINPGA